MALITLPEVRKKLVERENRMWDRTIPASRLKMDETTGEMFVERAYSTDRHPLQDQALTLLGTKLGVPANYLRKCPEDLRAKNVNHWLRRMDNKDLFVRFDGDEIRAVLSTRYQPVSNLDVVNVFTDHDRYRVDFDLTPTRMVARLVAGDMRRKMGHQDLVHGGVILSNSEVGFGSLELSAFLYRVVCTNGLVIPERHTFRRIHVGNGREDLMDELREASEHIIASLPNNMDALRATQEARVPDPLGVIERINDRHKVTEREGKAVERAWERERGDRFFHVINTYTGAANDNGLKLDSRDKLQRIGGKLLVDAASGKWLN